MRNLVRKALILTLLLLTMTLGTTAYVNGSDEDLPPFYGGQTK